MVSLRPAVASDDHFLRQLHRSTRADIVGAAPPGLRDALAEQQFAAQRHEIMMRSPAPEESIILSGSLPVGSLLTAHTPEAIELIDIALIPAVTGQGIGTAVLRGLCASADAGDLPIRAAVYHTNPRALALYHRFGFVDVGADDLLVRIERAPAADTS